MITLSNFNWIQLVKKDTSLPPNAKYLCFYLSTFMNAEQNVAWPSMTRISHETGLSKITVRKWVEYLENAGWLVTRKNSHFVTTAGGGQFQNEYEISIPEGVIREVSNLPPSNKGGSTVAQRGVSSFPKGGKQLTPNNNRIINKIIRESFGGKIPHFSDETGWSLLGEKLGLQPRPGESWPTYQGRIKNLIQEENR